MKTGIGLGEILVILTLIVVFVNPKQLPDLLRKTLKTVGQLRVEVRKYLDDVGR